MNKKVLKYLLVIELILIIAFFLILFSTRNRNDFSGLVAIYPMTGAIIIGVAILILLFIESSSKVAKTPSSKGTTAKDLWVIIPLIGVPALGWYYASIGHNRTSLELVSIVCFGLGVLFSLLLLNRVFKTK